MHAKDDQECSGHEGQGTGKLENGAKCSLEDGGTSSGTHDPKCGPDLGIVMSQNESSGVDAWTRLDIPGSYKGF